MRLLVIDDNTEIIDFLVPALERESFAVDSALDGEKGLFLAETNPYDLIILDNILPRKTGMEVCTVLREKGHSVPILLLSIKTETDEKINFLNAGADDYLTKPFSYSELLSRVKAILRRPQTIQETCLSVGDITLNTTTYEVRRGKKLIHLTRKEFALLELLLRHRGSVVSRGMIIEHVWDIEGDLFSKTIETHILNLRKKINTPRTNYIISVPGRGYKIA
jgi:DNA-binding response OmpR family regulator